MYSYTLYYGHARPITSTSAVQLDQNIAKPGHSKKQSGDGRTLFVTPPAVSQKVPEVRASGLGEGGKKGWKGAFILLFLVYLGKYEV